MSTVALMVLLLYICAMIIVDIAFYRNQGGQGVGARL